MEQGLRSIGNPIFKYLGYLISSNLGWGKMIKQTKDKV